MKKIPLIVIIVSVVAVLAIFLYKEDMRRITLLELAARQGQATMSSPEQVKSATTASCAEIQITASNIVDGRVVLVRGAAMTSPASCEDIVSAIGKVNADFVVLPTNLNIRGYLKPEYIQAMVSNGVICRAIGHRWSIESSTIYNPNDNNAKHSHLSEDDRYKCRFERTCDLCNATQHWIVKEEWK